MNIISEVIPHQIIENEFLELEKKGREEEEKFIKTMEKNPLLAPLGESELAGPYKYENIKTLTDLNLLVEELNLPTKYNEILFNFNRDFLKDPLNIKKIDKYYNDLVRIDSENLISKDFFLGYINKINKEYIKNVLLTPEEYNHFRALAQSQNLRIHSLSHQDMVLMRPKITNYRLKMLKFSKYFDYEFESFTPYTEGSKFYQNLLKLNIHNAYYNLKMLGYVLGFVVGITFIFSGGIVTGYIINIKKSSS